jgi:hypothetical protein
MRRWPLAGKPEEHEYITLLRGVELLEELVELVGLLLLLGILPRWHLRRWGWGWQRRRRLSTGLAAMP